MSKHLRADGRVRGASLGVPDGSLRPALTDIPGACAYLGNIGRTKFYSDLLSELDVVKFGTRTFVTLESLDRLITANCQLAKEADEASSEPIRRHSSEREHRPGGGALYRGKGGDGERVAGVLPSHGRAGRLAQGPVTEPEPEPTPPRDARKLGQA
jgi:hypothetical protein